MVIIKRNKRIVALALFFTLLMYPRTLVYLFSTAKNAYIAGKLSSYTPISRKNMLDHTKTKVVLMFDGGRRSVYTEAYSIMKEYGFRASVQIIPSRINEAEHMSYDQLARLYLDGWSLLNHTYSHQEDMYNSSDELLSDINKARHWMHNRYIGYNSDSVAIPFGEINPYLIGELKAAGYYSIRTSDNIIMLDNDVISYFPIATINILSTMSVERIKSTLLHPPEDTEAVVLIFNNIGASEDNSRMTFSTEKFKELITFIQQSSDKLQVITYSDLLY